MTQLDCFVENGNQHTFREFGECCAILAIHRHAVEYRALEIEKKKRKEKKCIPSHPVPTYYTVTFFFFLPQHYRLRFTPRCVLCPAGTWEETLGGTTTREMTGQ
jgi:hypothetical protein